MAKLLLALLALLSINCTTAAICGHAPEGSRIYAVEWKDADLTAADPGFGEKHALSLATVVTSDNAGDQCISQNANINDPQTSVYCGPGIIVWEIGNTAQTTAFGYQDQPVFYGPCQVFDPATETVRVVQHAAVLLAFCQPQFPGSCPAGF